MSWSLYRWTWRLESPLYVGIAPAGSLNRCRLYIPARTFWAALTAELARHRSPQNTNLFPDYDAIGKHLQTDFRFTYLYPAEEVNGNWKAWLPQYVCDKGLVWCSEKQPHQQCEDRTFRQRLLHTRSGIAIDAVTDTTTEGSLRETECVQTRWRDDASQDAGPVAFVGYALAKTPQAIDQLCSMEVLFVGGDTRYGLGKLRLIDKQEADHVFSHVELRGDSLVLKGNVVLAHTKTSRKMVGAREVLVGWDARKRWLPAGDATPLWTPGSRVDQKDPAAAFRIEQTGIWCLE